MELYYTLLGVYSVDTAKMKLAEEKTEKMMESGYVEDREIIELAKETDSVISIEVEQDDGYMEFIVVNNLGVLKRKEIFSVEEIPLIANEIKKQGIDNYFPQVDINLIEEHSKEYAITKQQFVDGYLYELLAEKYEQKKGRVLKKFNEYYKKR